MRPAIFAVGAAAATWSAPAAAAHAPALAAALRIATRVDGLPGVALTFDDGPHPAGTPAVLAALERGGARATFFLVGEQVRRDPALAREIVAAGHAVALHGDRHRCQLRLTPRALDDDLARVAATVADATGLAPALYRPPYGVFSIAGLALVRRRGWRDLLWSRWGRDWRARTTAEAIAPTRDARPRAPATSSCSTTPTPTAPRGRGGGRRRRCRRCWRRCSGRASRPWRSEAAGRLGPVGRQALLARAPQAQARVGDGDGQRASGQPQQDSGLVRARQVAATSRNSLM